MQGGKLINFFTSISITKIPLKINLTAFLQESRFHKL